MLGMAALRIRSYVAHLQAPILRQASRTTGRHFSGNMKGNIRTGTGTGQGWWSGAFNSKFTGLTFFRLAAATAVTSGLVAAQAEEASADTAPPKAEPRSSSNNKVDDDEDKYVDLSNLQKWDRNWDGKRHKPRGKKTRYIILVRHGQYHTEEKLDENRKLTELGHRQAELLVQRVEGLSWKPTRIWSSTLTRAKQTADHFRQSKEFATLFDDSSDDESGSDDVQGYIEEPNLCEGRPYQSVPVHRRYTKAQVAKDGTRINRAFRRLFYRAPADQEEDSYDLVVCHANVIRYFVCRALQLPPEAWLRFSLPHCSMTILTIRPSGNVSVRCVGDSGFLPGDAVTTK